MDRRTPTLAATLPLTATLAGCGGSALPASPFVMVPPPGSLAAQNAMPSTAPAAPAAGFRHHR